MASSFVACAKGLKLMSYGKLLFAYLRDNCELCPVELGKTMRLNGMNENVMRCAAISYGGGQKYSSDESLNLIDITEYPGGC